MRHRTDCHLVWLESVASTNDEVLVRARQLGEHALRRDGGQFVPLIVISGRQTAGRGRLGRSWASPPGGLYLSALVEVAARREQGRAQGQPAPQPILDPASFSLVVALAVRDALQGLAAGELRVKWPNDIMTAKGKLVGVSIGLKQGYAVFPDSLTSGAAGAAGRAGGAPAPTTASRYAVIGVGVNVNRPSEGAFERAAYLNDGTTGPLSLERIADELINTLLGRYGDWVAGHGSFVPFVEEYRAHMALIGDAVCVRGATGVEIARGTVEGVDDKGRLLLAGEGGLVAVAAGEVTLRDPPVHTPLRHSARSDVGA